MEPGHPNLELDFLATVFEVARIGICVSDEAGVFVRVNPAFCEMVGYRAEDLVGKDYTMCAPPSVVKVRDRFLQALLSDSDRIPREWMIRRSDGSVFDVLVSFRPITRADGRRFVVITFSDITGAKRAQHEIAALNRDLEARIAQRTAELTANLCALKAAEEALRESEERTRLIVETARDAMMSMNEDGRIGGWNRQAEEMFGCRRDEAIGQCFWDLTLAVEHHRPLMQRLQRYAVTGDANLLHETLELAAVRRDGHHFPVEVSLWPTRFAGELTFNASIRDISLRKQLEAEATERSERLLMHRDRLLDLSQLNKTDFDFALRRILEVEARTLGVERVGYWALAPDRSAIRCENLYCRSLGRMDEAAAGLTLHADDDPYYFGLIAANRPVISRNAQADPGVSGPTQRYFVEHNISGTLDTPVWFKGQVVGALSNEHVGAPRAWTTEEVDFATAAANMISLALEASSRVRAQAELAQSEQKYHRVIDLSREGFWLINGRNETIEVNSALCQMLGYAKEEMLGRTPLEFVDAENRAILVRRLVPRPAPAAATYELELTRKDGTKVQTMYNATAVFNANGEREFSFAFVTDITERKQLDAELRRALTERDAMLHSSLVGIAFVKDSRYVWVNKTYEQSMLGYEEGELSGQPTALTYSSSERFERLLPEILAALSREGVYSMEARVKRKNGSLVWCLVSGRALDPANVAAGSIWTLADISQRKAAEAELVQALSREKELNELKSRFISMTSHEFRTPLAAILSSIELLADYGERLPPEEKADLFGLVKDAVRRMTHMLEDVLFIGKSEAGRLEFRPQPLGLRAFCARLVDEFRSFMGRHNELYLELNGEDRAYVLDAELLRHILGNLLSNAVKYSPERTPVDLRVTCHTLGVRFTVVDRGIGIPADDQPLLFQTFHRGRNVGNVAGTGLGLAIVKTAVDLHGGTIRVDTQTGRGTRVTVDLPEAGAVAND